MKKLAILCALLMFSVMAVAQTTPNVSRKAFTAEISNREPVATITEINSTVDGSVYYFTELMNCQDNTVKHVWKVNDTVVHELAFAVKGPRWRVNSSMKLAQFKPGTVVTVDVVGADSTVYSTETITIK